MELYARSTLWNRRQNASLTLCQSEASNQKVTEHYYYVYMLSRNSDSPLQDWAASPMERPWTFLIRGEKRFQSFASALQKAGKNISLEEGAPFPDMVLKQANIRYDGYFPGLLTKE